MKLPLKRLVLHERLVELPPNRYTEYDHRRWWNESTGLILGRLECAVYALGQSFWYLSSLHCSRRPSLTYHQKDDFSQLTPKPSCKVLHIRRSPGIDTTLEEEGDSDGEKMKSR